MAVLRRVALALALCAGLSGSVAAQTVRIIGAKTPNVSTPTANENIPTMPAIACSSTQTLTAGRVVFPCTDVYGSIWVTFRNSDGTAATLGGDVTEDAAETNGETGPKVMSTRRDTAASSAGTSGDNATFNTDSLGRLWTRPGRPCDDEARITSVAINISSATTTELVALASGQIVYVCSWEFVTTLANNVTWKYGTGSACGTGTASITGAEPYAANGGVAIANTGAVQMKNIVSNALCLTTSAATQISGKLLYVQTAAP